MAKKEKETTKKKKSNLNVTTSGKAFITCTYNNTIINITNNKGDTVCSASPGVVGFKGAKKNTPYAATITAEDVGKKALDKGVQVLEVITKGPGSSKIPAIKGLKSAGLKIRSIRDITPIPHNGCRPRKKRRV